MYYIHVTGQGNWRRNAVAAGDHEDICEANWPVNDDGAFAVPHGVESEGLELRTVVYAVALCALDCAS